MLVLIGLHTREYLEADGGRPLLGSVPDSYLLITKHNDNSEYCLKPDVHCVNGLKDCGETDVDCGGTCRNLPNGKCPIRYSCGINDDCENTRICINTPTSVQANANTNAFQINLARASAPSGVISKLESNSKGPAHMNLIVQSIPTPAPTSQGMANPRFCAAAHSCSNGRRDGDESATDCGGLCSKCPNYIACNTDSDCQSGYCGKSPNYKNYCKPLPSCYNDIMDGTETDVDCGGNCPQCRAFFRCKKNDDCDTGFCGDNSPLQNANAGLLRCRSDSCFDGILSGTETDVDCGGLCGKCYSYSGCKVPEDCRSGECKYTNSSEKANYAKRCTTTKYPTPSPTMSPTVDERFSTGTILPRLPAAFKSTGLLEEIMKCNAPGDTWESCSAAAGKNLRSCATLAQTPSKVSDLEGTEQYRHWARNRQIPADVWFGCQLLSQPVAHGMSLNSPPGGHTVGSTANPFTPAAQLKMIDIGCYEISILPQSTTKSTVRHWADAQDHQNSASESLSKEVEASAAWGVSFFGAGMSAKYDSTRATSSATYRSSNNVGASINRRLMIAKLRNTCLEPAKADISQWMPGVVKAAEDVLVLSRSTPFATQVNPEIMSKLAILGAFGGMIANSWHFAYFYIFDMSVQFTRQSTLTTSEASSGVATASELNMGLLSGEAKTNMQKAFSDKSGSSSESSRLRIDVATSGRCAWYPDQAMRIQNQRPVPVPKGRRMTEITEDAPAPVDPVAKAAVQPNTQTQTTATKDQAEAAEKIAARNSNTGAGQIASAIGAVNPALAAPAALAAALIENRAVAPTVAATNTLGPQTVQANNALFSEVGGLRPQSSAALNPAQFDPSLSQLEYSAWQNCNADDFREWGGMVPLVEQNGGSITALLDRIGLPKDDFRILANAYYKFLSGTSGWYGVADDFTNRTPDATFDAAVEKRADWTWWGKEGSPGSVILSKAIAEYDGGSYSNGPIQWETCRKTRNADFSSSFCGASPELKQKEAEARAQAIAAQEFADNAAKEFTGKIPSEDSLYDRLQAHLKAAKEVTAARIKAAKAAQHEGYYQWTDPTAEKFCKARGGQSALVVLDQARSSCPDRCMVPECPDTCPLGEGDCCKGVNSGNGICYANGPGNTCRCLGNHAIAGRRGPCAIRMTTPENGQTKRVAMGCESKCSFFGKDGRSDSGVISSNFRFENFTTFPRSAKLTSKSLVFCGYPIKENTFGY